MKMKAIARFGKEFGSYKLVEVPYPTCGPEDIILEIKAAMLISGRVLRSFTHL